MHKSLTVLLTAGLILANCGWRDSRVNPGNWFDGGDSVPAEAAAGETNPLVPTVRSGLLSKPKASDKSVPIENIAQLRIERTSSGAIIHATGIGIRQGAHNAFLKPETGNDLADENGVLSYSFSVLYPEQPTNVGPENTRRVEVARTLTTQQLKGVRVIRVSGVQNAHESRRR